MKKISIIIGVIVVSLVGLYAVASFFSSCYGDYSCYRFASYEEFRNIKTESPKGLGGNGNLGEMLPLELVPTCAEDILYKYDLDTNEAELEFRCGVTPAQIQYQDSWQLDKVKGDRYFLRKQKRGQVPF